jgi:C1A family cysteine protease
MTKSGHLAMPGPKEQCLGGHAVMAVGYNDSKQWFVIRNSWGPKWGLKGYFTIPYAYLTDSQLADDFWTIRLV